MKSGSNKKSDSNDSIKTSEVLHESVTKQTKNKQLLIVNTISQRCNAMHQRVRKQTRIPNLIGQAIKSAGWMPWH